MIWFDSSEFQQHVVDAFIFFVFDILHSTEVTSSCVYVDSNQKFKKLLRFIRQRVSSCEELLRYYPMRICSPKSYHGLLLLL